MGTTPSVAAVRVQVRRAATARRGRLRLARRYPQIVLGSLVVLVFVVVGTFAPQIAPYDYDDQNLGNQLKPPIWGGGQMAHPLGTDEFGRDTLSRLIYGARVSLIVGFFSVVVAGGIGITIGTLGAYFGGTIDSVITSVSDVQYSFPYILVAIIITALWGPGLVTVIVALGLASWMTFARTARGSTLAVKEGEYIAAAQAVGAGHLRIICCHILRNISPPLIVFSTFQVPSRILAEAALSFVGLGIQPPMPSWGNMLAQNRGYLVISPWLVILPGLALTVVALAVNQLGDGLRDLLDPRLRSRIERSRERDV
jgi:peptide/nickel transport system permease protein